MRQSLPNAMRSSASSFDKRVIALLMLFVWLFTVGAGFANACTPDGTGSGPARFDTRYGAASDPTQAAARMAARKAGHAPGHGNTGDARHHQVHCQPLQPLTQARAITPGLQKSVDLDAIVAIVLYVARHRLSDERRASARWRLAPVASQLPLFIQFRRLIP